MSASPATTSVLLLRSWNLLTLVWMFLPRPFWQRCRCCPQHKWPPGLPAAAHPGHLSSAWWNNWRCRLLWTPCNHLNGKNICITVWSLSSVQTPRRRETTYSGRGQSFVGHLGECWAHWRKREASIQRSGSGSGAETWLRIRICLVKEVLPGPAGPASCFQRGSWRVCGHCLGRLKSLLVGVYVGVSLQRWANECLLSSSDGGAESMLSATDEECWRESCPQWQHLGKTNIVVKPIMKIRFTIINETINQRI